MNPLLFFYNELLWRPLFNGLIFFYNGFPWQEFGLAIIALTIIIRLVLTPIFLKAQHAQKKLGLLQPEIKKLQEQHKNNKETQGKALMELYASHKVNPFSGCLMMLLQLPILIALFGVFQGVFKPENLSYLYSFVQNPGTLNPLSFGILDLSKGNIYLGALAAFSQYWQSKLTLAAVPPAAEKGEFTKVLQWQTLYFLPVLVLFWSYSLPAALTLYWTVLNILGIVQEIILHRGHL
jgi:YidC/Oxa1 family membrane protein insertase